MFTFPAFQDLNLHEDDGTIDTISCQPPRWKVTPGQVVYELNSRNPEGSKRVRIKAEPKSPWRAIP
jgi:hypothetical protein